MAHRAGVLVLGTNKNCKQKAWMGASNTRSNVGMPIFILRAMITYKAHAAGITVIEQEESYTSKADFLSGDHIPIYGKDDPEVLGFHELNPQSIPVKRIAAV